MSNETQIVAGPKHSAVPGPRVIHHDGQYVVVNDANWPDEGHSLSGPYENLDDAEAALRRINEAIRF